MSERWSEWERIEAAQAAADRQGAELIPFPAQGAPAEAVQRSVEAEPSVDAPAVAHEPPERPTVDDATGMRLLARWMRQLFPDQER